MPRPVITVRLLQSFPQIPLRPQKSEHRRRGGGIISLRFAFHVRRQFAWARSLDCSSVRHVGPKIMSHLALSDTTCHAVELYPCLGSCLSQHSSAATHLTSPLPGEDHATSKGRALVHGPRACLISAIKRISYFEHRARDSFGSTRCESLKSGVLSGNLTL